MHQMNINEIKQKITEDYLSLTPEDILDFQQLSTEDFLLVNKYITTAMRKQSGIIQSSQEYIIIFPKDATTNNKKNRFYQDALAIHAQTVNQSLFNTLSGDFSDTEIILAISKQKDKIEPTDSLKKALDSLKDFFNPQQLLTDLGASDSVSELFVQLIKTRKNIRDTLVLSLTNTIRKLSNKIKKDEEKKIAAYKSLSDYLIRYINEIGFDPKGKTFDSSKASFLTKMTKDLMLQFIKPTSVEEDLYYAKKCITLINKDYQGSQETTNINPETSAYIDKFTQVYNQDPTYINIKGNIKSDFLKFVMIVFAGYIKNNPDQREFFNEHLPMINSVLVQAKSEAETKLSNISSVSKAVSLTNDEGVNVIENQPSNDKPYDEDNQSSDHILYLDFLLRSNGKYSDAIITSFLSSFDKSIKQPSTISNDDLELFDQNIDASGSPIFTLSNLVSTKITKDIYATQIKLSKKIHKMISKHGYTKFAKALMDSNDLSMEYDIYNLFIESTHLKISRLINENKMSIQQLLEAGLVSKNEMMICFLDEAIEETNNINKKPRSDQSI